MQTFDTIITRKGVRSFTDQQISDEQLKKLIHVANASPISGGGFRDSARQLTVIKNVGFLNKISEIVGAERGGDNPLYGAKTLIIISAPENTFHAEQLDVGIMAQTILLGATDMGLNSILMTSIIHALRTDTELNTKLNIPNKYVPYVGIAIGYTDDDTVKTREYRDDNVNYIL